MTLQAEIKTGKNKRAPHDDNEDYGDYPTIRRLSSRQKPQGSWLMAKGRKVKIVKGEWGKEARINSTTERSERMTQSKLRFLFFHPELFGLPVWEGH